MAAFGEEVGVGASGRPGEKEKKGDVREEWGDYNICRVRRWDGAEKKQRDRIEE